MSARYWVLVSDELFAGEDTIWPPGLRPVMDLPERKLAASRHDIALPLLAPMGWREFADEDADPELDGHKVSVVVRNECGRVFVSERRIIE